MGTPGSVPAARLKWRVREEGLEIQTATTNPMTERKDGLNGLRKRREIDFLHGH